MQTSLAVTALLMGLVGGPHCVAMCGAPCAAIAHRRDGGTAWGATAAFHAGRIIGYAALGGFAAFSMQGLGWLTSQSVVLRPVWSLFHVAVAVLGLTLVWQARQPVWLERAGRRLWGGVQRLTGSTQSAGPLLLGVAWVFLPCGLLYSALLVAALAGQAWEGALVMALFASGTLVTLLIGPWLWLRLRGPSAGHWGVRLAGLALTASSVWALWMGLVHDTAPWCVNP